MSDLDAYRASMDEEESDLTFALGALVREAAELEYVLHGLLVHLAGEPRAYAYQPGATGGKYTKMCQDALDAYAERAAVDENDLAALRHDLDLCKARFKDRDRCVHGYWNYDDERQSWLTLKGSREKGRHSPETEFASSSDVFALATELYRLNQKLAAWDATYFGEIDEETGQVISVKRW